MPVLFPENYSRYSRHPYTVRDVSSYIIPFIYLNIFHILLAIALVSERCGSDFHEGQCKFGSQRSSGIASFIDPLRSSLALRRLQVQINVEKIIERDTDGEPSDHHISYPPSTPSQPEDIGDLDIKVTHAH